MPGPLPKYAINLPAAQAMHLHHLSACSTVPLLDRYHHPQASKYTRVAISAFPGCIWPVFPPCLQSHLRQRRFGLRQPEGHVHSAI